ncbi:MAG TPA: hypothetical protein VN673_04490, partial [Clostridia bacterium]|nr:hypothetical protein [Clostridia bacterium]
MKVIVTRDDIDNGRRRDPNDCAVARALRRAGVAHSGVTGMLVFLDMDRQRTSLLLPGRVQEWIVDFDWGAAVDPIEFDLTIPTEPNRRIQPELPLPTKTEVGAVAPRNRTASAASRLWSRKSSRSGS